MAQSFQIDEPALAMLELSKGKLTSDPQRHTGRGLFFTARVADVLDLHANGTAFQHRAWQHHRWQRTTPASARGTSIFVAIALDTPVTLDAVLREHSSDGNGYAFERTVVPLRLLASPRARARFARPGPARRVAACSSSAMRGSTSTACQTSATASPTNCSASSRAVSRGSNLEPMNMSPSVRALVDSVRAEAT